MVSALVNSAPFRREDSLAFMNVRLGKFHEALINVPCRLSGVSPPEFMDVECVQVFLLRHKVRRCRQTVGDSKIEVEDFVFKPAPYSDV